VKDYINFYFLERHYKFGNSNIPMGFKTNLYSQFDNEGIKGNRKSLIKVSFGFQGASIDELSNTFSPASDYYRISTEELNDIIIDYVYDTTSLKIDSIQDLRKLQSINGLPFFLELADDDPSYVTYSLARRFVPGSIAIRDKQIISLGNIEEIDGDLALIGSLIRDLGNLRKVNGSLWIAQFHPFTNLETLGNLEIVSKDLYLKGAPVKDLNNLQKVGGTINLRNTQIESLGKLTHVGHCLYLPKLKKGQFDLTSIQINGSVRYYSK
jgi:hypothetical protein